MVRVSHIAAALVAIGLLAPSGAFGDSLLSGYSRPGGGEQQVLGPGLLPAKHGNGSIRAPKPVAQSAPAAPAPGSTPTPAPTPTSTKTVTHPSRPATHHTTPVPHSKPVIVPGTPSTSAAPKVALPAAVVYPDAASASGAGLPLSGPGIALVLLAIVGMVALALATRRTAQPSG